MTFSRYEVISLIHDPKGIQKSLIFQPISVRQEHLFGAPAESGVARRSKVHFFLHNHNTAIPRKPNKIRET